MFLFLFTFPVITLAGEPRINKISWQPNPKNANRNVQGYIIDYGRESGNYIISITVGKRFDYPLVLENDSTYYFVVRAFNKAGISAFADEKEFTVPKGAEITDIP